MENQFVPYELAVKLKELGFDEPCICYFNKSENNQLWQDIDGGYYRNNVVSIGNLLWGGTYDNGNVSAPLWQQAFDWFRENYGYHSWVYQSNLNSFHFTILEHGRYARNGSYTTNYQEGRTACLEKLIELITNK